MTSNVVVGPGLTPDWLRKRDRIFSALADQVLLGVENPGAGLLLDQLQLVVEHRSPFVQPIEQAELADVIALQQEKWHKVFPQGSLDFSDLVVWPRRTGHDWGILTPKHMTNNRLFAACQEKGKFPCWQYRENLNEIGPAQSFTTLRWFKKIQEADEEYQDLSATMLLKRLVPGVWLQERVWMELDWFLDTGDHLDKKSATLVTGSFDPNGNVPLVDWDGGRFYVSAHRPDEHHPNWRARTAG